MSNTKEGGMTPIEAERAAFEAWVDEYNAAQKHWQFSMSSPISDHCWAAWQAARAQPQAQAEPVAWLLRPKVQRHPDRTMIRGIYYGPRTPQDFEFAELDGDEYIPLYAHPPAQPDAEPAADPKLLDLAMMLRTCAWALRRGTAPDLGERALELLKKHGLLGSPLRDGAQPAAEPDAKEAERCKAAIAWSEQFPDESKSARSLGMSGFMAGACWRETTAQPSAGALTDEQIDAIPFTVDFKNATLRDLCLELRRFARAIEAAVGAQPAAEPAQCSWSQDGEDSDSWQTSCGRYFRLDEGDPNDNRMYHCCFCGKPIDCNPYIAEDES